MRKQPLPRPVEDALRPRLLDGASSPVQSPVADLFPAELEAALDSTVKRFRSSERKAPQRR